MDKHVDRLSKDLKQIAEVVNAFESEAVQLKIIEHLLPELINFIKSPSGGTGTRPVLNPVGSAYAFGNKKSDSGEKLPGSTKVLRQLAQSDFFDVPRSISDIVNYYTEKFGFQIPANRFSGVLLTLVKQNKLHRLKNNHSKCFEYIKYSSTDCFSDGMINF